MPKLAGFDHSRALAGDPYRFISRHCRDLSTPVFQARFGWGRTLCLSGARAAELFFDRRRFVCGSPSRALMRPMLLADLSQHDPDNDVLFGDARDVASRLMPPDAGQALVDGAERIWYEMTHTWRHLPEFVFYRVTQQWLVRTALDWAGVPVPKEELALRSGQLIALFDSAASGPLALLNGRRARWQAESWLADVITQARRGQITLDPGTPAQAASGLRQDTGELVAARRAAGELLDLLVPVAAVSVFVVLAAHALAMYPEQAAALRGEGSAQTLAFVQEVQRFYPFLPLVTAHVREDFVWDGYRFSRGQRAMLDLYGACHDPKKWGDPDVFRPQRFLEHAGAGEVPLENADLDPGQRPTVRLMCLAVQLLGNCSRYELAEQDLSIQMSRMPAVPSSGLLIRDFQPIEIW